MVAAVIAAVVFDVGETLIDETREYGTWADWLGVPRHTFAAVFGATIAAGKDYREAFQMFQPGFDLTNARRERAAAGQPEWFGEDDLYQDVRPTLAELRDTGTWVAIVGNQTARSGKLLRELHLPADLIATSDDWGVEKPSVQFFEKVIEEAPCGAAEIVYVGDRIDNDVAPASKAGMRTAHIRRGPWGWLSHNEPEAVELPDWRVNNLTELPTIVAAETESAGP